MFVLPTAQLRKSAAAAAVVLAVSLAAPAVSLAQAPKHGGTAVFGIAADPNYTTRSLSNANEDGLIGCILYQGLTQVDNVGNIQPMLAKSWTVSDDGLSYTFQLVTAQWQDGQPFTSEDVQYSLLEANSKYSAVFAGAARAIASIDAPAPDRVTIHLKQAYGPLLLSLACSQGGSILPAHIFKGTDVDNPAINSKPVGIGPFMLTEWKRGDYVRLTRNPHYWEPGKPYLDEVIAKVIPQASSRTLALMAGDVDYLTALNLPVSDYPAVRGNPKLALDPAPIAPATHLMFLNVNHKPLDDRRVRQALMVGIDRNYLTRVAYLGAGTEGTMPFTNRIPWAADPKIDYNKMYPFDPAKANALLDEAGVKRGADGTRFSMNIVYSTDDSDGPSVTAAVKSMWAALGVNLTIQPMERTAAAKVMYTDRSCDASLQDISSFFDPAIGTARSFTTAGIGKAYANGAGYSNPEVDDLFIKGEQSTSEAERGKYYGQIQDILANDLPVLTLHEEVQFVGQSVDLHGLETENQLPTWRDAWLDR